MIQKTVLVVFLLLVGVNMAWAGSLGIGFNDESAQIDYLHVLSRETYGESEAGLRLLYNEESEVVLGGLGAGIKGVPGNFPGLMTGVSVNLTGADTDFEDLLAIGIGLQVGYIPPRMQGLGLTAGVLYSPDVFTFMDAEDYLETRAGLFFTFMPRAALNLTYQNILVEFEEFGEVRLDETVRIGIRLEF
ncbi:MAG: hypothetical protein C0619_14370 [Desulfuromonas sp.]|nr:MAG: hypothetical protein C0619_14370 [Desulfuromonas sp.]